MRDWRAAEKTFLEPGQKDLSYEARESASEGVWGMECWSTGVLDFRI
jgi:hypothetical protein